MHPALLLCRRSTLATVVVWLLVSPACSTDTSGLGDSAGHPGLGKGGAGGKLGTGGKGGTTGGSGSGGITNVGGKVGSGGGVGTGGAGTGTGGAVGGHAGSAAGGGIGSGGKGGGKTGGAGGVASGGKGGGAGGAGGVVASGGKGGGQAGAAGGASGGQAGGASGGGGTAGHPGSGGAGGAVGPECQHASDCTLYDGCCVCEAQPVNSTPPVDCAGITCIQTQCKAEQLPSDAVDCVAGRCVAGFNCDASEVTCKMAVPACEKPGYVPAVNPSGSCFTGGCVPADQCTRVTACSACGSSLACVIYETQMGNQFHCVSRPAGCKNSLSCDCLGKTSCTGSYRTCTELSGQPGILCSCPNC